MAKIKTRVESKVARPKIESQRPPSPERKKPESKKKEPTTEEGKKKESAPKRGPKKLKLVEITKGTVSTPGESKIKRRKPKLKVLTEGRESELVLGETIDVSRLPKKKDDVLIRASAYYMNNREIFVNFINSLFQPYREELMDESQEVSCESKEDKDFSLLTHQKIVRDYLNLFTPYRGLLLYHGLGSGKTCSSIAIAEGMKTSKKVVIMTPASLRRNYIEELKKCGDAMYKKNQFWEYINTSKNKQMVEPLSKALGLSTEYIESNGGAWLVNVKKKPNYETLSSGDKSNLEKQLNEMIRNKYQFINYNGLRSSHLDSLSKDGQSNPFDNSVVIIDEAHNFISRIVNKINKPESLSMRLYEFLLAAEDCRVILLTGTPIINYPNEIGILFNILRGYIKTWHLPLAVKTQGKVNIDTIQKMFPEEVRSLIDFVDYRASSKMLIATRDASKAQLNEQIYNF